MDGGGLWLYRDGAGGEHLVQKREDVPEAYRASAVLVGAGPRTEVSPTTGLGALVHTPDVPGGLDPASFALGFGAATALVLAMVVARRAPAWVFRFVVLTAVAAVGVVGYFTWVRHQAGLPGVGTPDRMVEDARDAARIAGERLRAQEEQLREIE